MTRYPLRPRYRGLAWSAVGVGGVLAVLSIGAAPIVLVSAVCGLGLGGAYLGSPTWRMAVVVDDDALTVTAGAKVRFTLPWSEIKRVVASPSTQTCFVDGGDAARSIVIPGDGAPAPYRIDDRQELYRTILSKVSADKIETVALLSDRMS
jgi:hypothetical protein